LDYIQNIYTLNTINQSDTAYENKKYSSIKDSNQLLSAIEAGKLILQKHGGKLIVFNASNSWINSKYFTTDMNSAGIFSLSSLTSSNNIIKDKNKSIYENLDINGYLKELGKELCNSLISCDIFYMPTQKDVTYLIIFRIF
jgi:hypothetical protein